MLALPGHRCFSRLILKGCGIRAGGVKSPAGVTVCIEVNPPMPIELSPQKPVYIDDDHCVRTLGDVIVTFTKAPPSSVYLETWATEADRVVRQCGSLVVYTVISRLAPAPSEEAKAEIRKVMTRHDGKVRGVAYVVEGSGFAAAAMRSALTLIGFVARYSYPQKTVASVAEGSRWVAGLPGGDATGAGLVSKEKLDALVESMRREHERLCAESG